MTNMINPFYKPRATYIEQYRTPSAPVYAKLPRAPQNGSPVPHLTSLYHQDGGDDHGDRRYPGNGGANLIRDLLRFYSPANVLDPMTGSGSCQNVCRELGIKCVSSDLHQGQDACTVQYPAGTFDFVWLHPPYWRQKVYSNDPRDLSCTATLDEFLVRYRQLIANSAGALKRGGKLAILMGDYFDLVAGFVPLTFHTKRLAFEIGLVQAGTDIIRFSHGASSARKTYRSSFIPSLHDVCMIFVAP